MMSLLQVFYGGELREALSSMSILRRIFTFKAYEGYEMAYSDT
jgi:hypothetical protein